MSKFKNIIYKGRGTHTLILESLLIRLEHGKNYLSILKKNVEEYEKDSAFFITPTEIEIMKQLCESDLTLNKITENITLQLINDKLEIKY